jgi:DNA-binding NarL/FixJ family response regulator
MQSGPRRLTSDPHHLPAYSLSCIVRANDPLYFYSRNVPGPSGGPISSRILIVDDHEVVRMGVRTILAGDRRWEVCGEAANGDQAFEKIMELGPDVVILDLSMPSLSGYEVATAIRRILPSIKIIFFSMLDTPIAAQTIGGDAFVAKSSAARDLPLALERVLKHGGSARKTM